MEGALVIAESATRACLLGHTYLAMIESEMIGILYESSVVNMTFQAVKLVDVTD